MNIEKIKIIYYKISIILDFILSMMLAICIYKIEYIYQDFEKLSISYLLLAILIVCLIIANATLYIKRYKDKLEKIFLQLVIPIGILYMVLMIPCQAPDEEGHIFKAYDVSLGHLTTNTENNGDIYVPAQMLQMYRERIDTYSKLHKFISLECDYNTSEAVQTAAKSNSPIGYLASSTVYFIGRNLNLNIMIASYLAKLANFIVYIILGYYIIKIIPFGKLITFAYLLLPMILHQATSISSDAITNISVLLFIAYNLKLLKQDTTINVMQRIFYYILIVFISLGKVAYFPLVSVGYILIANKNINKKDKIKLLVISTILAAILGIGWYKWSLNYTDARDYYKEAGVDSTEQLNLIIHQPLQYCKILYNTINRNAGYYLVNFIGRDLGRLNINVPEITVYIFMLLLFATPFLESHKFTLNKIQRIWFILIFLGISLIIVTALFMGWTPVGFDYIAGVQGRYFIPIMLLILLCMCRKNKYIEFNNVNIFYAISFSLLNISAISTIIKFF